MVKSLSLDPEALIIRSLKAAVPAVVGVPLITAVAPVEVVSCNPRFWSVLKPETTDHVRVPVPPVEFIC
jgi:hypothetical protein